MAEKTPSPPVSSVAEAAQQALPSTGTLTPVVRSAEDLVQLSKAQLAVWLKSLESDIDVEVILQDDWDGSGFLEFVNTNNASLGPALAGTFKFPNGNAYSLARKLRAVLSPAPQLQPRLCASDRDTVTMLVKKLAVFVDRLDELEQVQQLRITSKRGSSSDSSGSAGPMSRSTYWKAQKAIEVLATPTDWWNYQALQLTDSALAVMFSRLVHSGELSEDEIFVRWKDLLGRLPQDSRLQLVDRHAVPSIAPSEDTAARLPDFPAYPRAPDLHTDFYLETLGDLKRNPKSMTGEPFSDDAKGQVAHYAHAVLSRHLHRTRFVCFLANAKIIQFFRFERQQGPRMRASYTQELRLADALAQRMLVSLLYQSAETLTGSVALGPIEVIDRQLSLRPTEYLGSGHSSVVYAANAAPRQLNMVLKIFEPLHEERLLRERSALSQFPDLVVKGGFKLDLEFRVPEVIGVARCPANWGSDNVLILYPRGRPLRHDGKKGASLMGAEAAALVDTLAPFHHAQIVHRDLSPANVYIVESGGRRRVMLNDFGLCVQSGVDVAVAGTQLFLADELLQAQVAALTGQAAVLPATAQHDLESLVKVFVQQTHPEFDGHLGPGRTAAWVLQQWMELAEQVPQVAEGLRLAREGDREELKIFFQRNMPYAGLRSKKRAAVP